MVRLALAEARTAWRTWAGVGLVFVAMQTSTVLLSVILASAQHFRAAATGGEVDQATSLANGAVSFGVFLAIAVIAVTASSVELAVNQRRGAMARLSLAGAAPQQIVASVLVQLLVVSLVAAVIGVSIALAVLPAVLAYVADAGIGPVGVPPVRSPVAVGWGVGLGAMLGLLGGWRQARAISRVSPVEAMRQAATSPATMTRLRWLLSIILLLLLGGAFATMPHASSVDDAASLGFIITLLATLLVAAAAPWVLPHFTRAWTSALPFRSAAWFLARRSIVSRLPRLSGVVVPLALAVALFIGLQSVSATLAASVTAATGQAPNGGAQTADLVIAIGLPLLVAIAGAVGGLIMSGQQRDADLAVVGVVGATPAQRAGQAVLEAAVLSITGLLLGALAAGTGLLSVAIGLRSVLSTVEVVFPWLPLVSIAGVACVVATLATLVPALAALQRPPHRVVAERIAE